MKLTKYILPIAAILMVFAVVEASAQICVFKEGEEYSLADAIRYKGDNVKFIKFCCDQLHKCSPNYFVDDKYMLTHIAAKYNRTAALEYLVKEEGIPANKFPVDLKNGGYDKTYTPVMFAATYRDVNKSTGLPSVQFLVEKYGEQIVTIKNKYNEDTLTLAKKTSDPALLNYVQSAWNKAMGFSAARVEKNKKDLIRVLTLNDIKDEIRNFQREIKFNGFFG